MYGKVSNSFVCSSQWLVTIQTFINKDKEIVVCSYDGTPLNNKIGGGTTNTHMFESQNNDSDWKKPDKKECILYDSICIKFQKMQTNLQ